jgi:hypothetical protein
MSLTQTQTTSFKKELYLAVHDFSTDIFKIALYTADATLNADTTVYTSTNEVVATGYTAGGIALTGASVDASSGVAYVSFNNAVWTAALTARGALIYNFSKSNKSVAVLDFGSDKTSGVTFTVQMPANTSTSALIRSAQG